MKIDLIEQLGGYQSAKRYLEWMERNSLLIGGFPIKNGRASFYVHTLKSQITEYEIQAGKRLEVCGG